MNTDQVLFAAAIMLGVTAAALGVARRLKLGSIAGLLLVGIILGPHSPLPLFTGHVADFQAIGETGVVLLLFLIGLDTQPGRLQSLRMLVFGFGAAEYAASVALITVLVLATSRINWQSALILGLGLAMSSSAVPLPILQLHGESDSPHGRFTLAADIFQSLVLVPMMIAAPLLAPAAPSDPTAVVLRALKAVAALGVVVLLGRFVMPALLAMAARSHQARSFRLVTLAGVCAAAWVMDRAGVSMALGAFIVGVMLSSSRYATVVKAAVMPARELLLSIFFIAVGMAIDIREAASFHSQLLFYLTAVMFLKLTTVYISARLFRVDGRTALLCGLLLTPLDEVGYVIFASAYHDGLLSARAHALAMLSISVSFAISPLVIDWALRLASPERGRGQPRSVRRAAGAAAATGRVVVVGYSDVGRIVCKVLRGAALPYIGFETDPRRLAQVSRGGDPIEYGDLSDPEFIAAAAVSQARLVVVAHDEYAVCSAVVAALQIAAPGVTVMVAVGSLAQAQALRALGASRVLALVAEGALAFAGEILGRLAVPPGRARDFLDAARADDFAVIGPSNLSPASPQACGHP